MDSLPLHTMTSKHNILFIINPISGTSSKESIPRLINSTLDKSKFGYDIVETTYAGQAAEIAKSVKDDADIIVAVGGDGTINEVARSIVGSSTALGIIPCGSGNGLARHLMLPMDIRRSIMTINQCKIRQLDYGIINDNPFFCTCGMGFDAFISHKFAEAGRRGLVTYVEKVFKEGIKYRPETYIVEDHSSGDTAVAGGKDNNGKCGRFTMKAFLISCANASQYGNNAYIAPQASMSDGLLDVIIMEPFDLIDAPQVIMDMMNKTLDKSPRIKTLRVNDITVHREKPGYIHYDGDPVMTTADVRIRLVSKGIRIIVNPAADKSKRRPNAIQSAFSDIFNDINEMRDDIMKQSRYLQELSRHFTFRKK